MVAHLALNAEGLAGALVGVARGPADPDVRLVARPATTTSTSSATAAPTTLRNRLLGGDHRVHGGGSTAVPDDAWDTEIERVPGGTRVPAGAVPGMREREVEIHHADLGLAYSAAALAVRRSATRLLDANERVGRRRAPVRGARDRPGPDDGSVAVVTVGATVSGTAADLGWWLTGRGDGSTD